MKVRQFVFAVVVIISSTSFVSARAQAIQSGSHGGKSKFELFYETYLSPGTPTLSNMGGGTVGGGTTPDVMHRVVTDYARQIYFGYDALVEVLTETNTFRLTFSELTMPVTSARHMLGDNYSSWTAVATPGWQASTHTVREGEIVALDLLMNSTTGQKIVEYLTVRKPREPQKVADDGPQSTFLYSPGTSKNLRPEDAVLKISYPRVAVNGITDPLLGSPRIEVSGELVWFYLPKHGRFILSLTPQPGFSFLASGVVRGNTVTVGDLGDEITLISSKQVAPGPGPYTLYVAHDRLWGQGQDHSTWGAAVRPELIGR